MKTRKQIKEKNILDMDMKGIYEGILAASIAGMLLRFFGENKLIPKYISVSFFTRLKLCYKILKTKGYSEDYTIKQLIEDDF